MATFGKQCGHRFCILQLVEIVVRYQKLKIADLWKREKSFFITQSLGCMYTCWVVEQTRPGSNIGIDQYTQNLIDFTQKSPAQCQQIPCPLVRPPNKRTMLCGSIYLDVEGTLSIYLEGC